MWFLAKHNFSTIEELMEIGIYRQKQQIWWQETLAPQKKKNIFKYLYHPDEKHFIWEHIIIKKFESCKFCDWIIDGLECFEEREQREITNHQRQILKNIKIMSLMTSNKFKAMTQLRCGVWKHNFDLYLRP